MPCDFDAASAPGRRDRAASRAVPSTRDGNFAGTGTGAGFAASAFFAIGGAGHFLSPFSRTSAGRTASLS